MFRWIGLALLALLTWSATPAAACGPFLGLEASRTLRETLADAKLIVYGTLSNRRLNSSRQSAEDPKGWVDLHVQRVLKSDPILQGRKVLELPCYVPVDVRKPPTFLIACDIYKGRLDPYFGREVPSQAVLEYLRPLVANPKQRDLVYFFRHLDHPDREVAGDAVLEFARADYRDVRPLARTFPADHLARLLKDPRQYEDSRLTWARVRLYATLLGDCGTAQHAELLRTMLAEQSNRAQLDGLLVGYTLLRPNEGTALLRGFLTQEKSRFMVRHAALRALRFLWDFRPDRVDRRQLQSALCVLLDQPDIADLAIEDLRKRNCAEEIVRVMDLYRKESHSAPIIRRAILRFALSCPRDPRAVEFVLGVRRDDPELVREVEESLEQEQANRRATVGSPVRQVLP